MESIELYRSRELGLVDRNDEAIQIKYLAPLQVLIPMSDILDGEVFFYNNKHYLKLKDRLCYCIDTHTVNEFYSDGYFVKHCDCEIRVVGYARTQVNMLKPYSSLKMPVAVRSELEAPVCVSKDELIPGSFYVRPNMDGLYLYLQSISQEYSTGILYNVTSGKLEADFLDGTFYMVKVDFCVYGIVEKTA